MASSIGNQSRYRMVDLGTYTTNPIDWATFYDTLTADDYDYWLFIVAAKAGATALVYRDIVVTKETLDRLNVTSGPERYLPLFAISSSYFTNLYRAAGSAYLTMNNITELKVKGVKL